MRILVECSFKGSAYHGWQKQSSGDPTIQGTLEKAISTLLRLPGIDLVGCGRTDAGVHALKYFVHFDHSADLPDGFLYHLNAILPKDIAVHTVKMVEPEFHARYDARSRTYTYKLHGYKSPFTDNLSFYCKQFDDFTLSGLQQAAEVLLKYDQFFPFCLSDSGVNNYKVEIFSVQWSDPAPGHLVFTISANRFLRGMVRLVTGMCINVALGRLSIAQVEESLLQQTLLPISLSIPAHGLYLADVRYPTTNLLDQMI